jgi:hypothetical protein
MGMTRRTLLGGGAAIAVLSACGGNSKPSTNEDDKQDDKQENSTGDAIGMSIASFDAAANFAAPITVGISDVNGMVLAYGSVELTIASTTAGAQDALKGPATFLPVPGRAAKNVDGGPKWVAPSESVGVYRTGAMQLAAGFYEVTAKWGTSEVTTGLEVLEATRVPLPGSAAPETNNPVIGTPDIPPAQIDSRASTAADLDPRIHTTVIADALAAGRPLVVAATTPVYCQSQFCGPITDVVADLSTKYPAVAFVHLEVWKDYDAATINDAAAEWIWPDGDGGRGANEPWVFAVDPDGTIAKRWANVLDLAELTDWLNSQRA